VEKILEMACKYESSQMANEVAVIPSLSVVDFGKTTIVARNIVTRASHLYVLGACFGIEWLEKKYRHDVVEQGDEWIFSPQGPSELKLLLQWAPQKLSDLLQDARITDNYDQRRQVDEVQERVSDNNAKAKRIFEHMDKVICLTKSVGPPF
jgi:hypothetical protein